ncbi:MAG TPA: hypothetical protein VEY71_07005 [Chitinophagales bacterium]|nr:hypothetical protein [Chitinophagales bacterium]
MKRNFGAVMQRILLIVVGLLLGTLLLNAQDTLPSTRIFLVPVVEDAKAKRTTFGTPVAAPPAGTYNNQPHFTQNGRLMYFAAASVNRKADIFALDVKKNEIRVWDSSDATAEYSPVITPDNKNVSFVRVEKDDTTQRLYQRALRGIGAQRIVPEELTIGYYTWTTPTSLALYVLKKPTDELVLYDLDKKAFKVIDTNPGRTIVKNALDGNLYYTKKKSDAKFMLMQYNPANEQPAEYCAMPEGSQDFAFHHGVLYASHDNKLIRWDTNAEAWKDVHDFSNTDVKTFYRFAFSPNGEWLALVSYDGKKP